MMQLTTAIVMLSAEMRDDASGIEAITVQDIVSNLFMLDRSATTEDIAKYLFEYGDYRVLKIEYKMDGTYNIIVRKGNI